MARGSYTSGVCLIDEYVGIVIFVEGSVIQKTWDLHSKTLKTYEEQSDVVENTAYHYYLA